jgi:GT2 family glycosyltransferase
MNTIFAMVTVKNSNFYTGHALESFFKYTQISNGDEFILIDNDGCDISGFKNLNKIKLVKNLKPLSFAENVNQMIDLAIKSKKDLIFITNDIIFTNEWAKPLLQNSESISIPSNNQIFPYTSDCGNLKLKSTMNFEDFNVKYNLLNQIVKNHKTKFKPNQKFETLLMPFFCFKIPLKIMIDVGYLDTSYGNGGGEDVDYRIRCISKGYNVHFLLDSYLLHFHGKSTWAIETKEETEKRNDIYIKTFLNKWGKDMTQIFILRKDFLNILEKRNLNNLFKKGKFTQIIKTINNFI